MTKRKTVAAKRREALVQKKIEKRSDRHNPVTSEERREDMRREDILNHLLVSLGIAGGYINYLSCDSTNNFLKKISQSMMMQKNRANNQIVKPPNFMNNIDDWMIYKLTPDNLPFVMTADEQTAGRGRQSNTWWTGPGSLALSMLLDAKQHGLKPQTSAQLSLAIGYAAMQALRRITEETLAQVGTTALPNIEIRWPNDVYVNDRKITGILIEMPNMHHTIIGIGVNTNNTAVDAPEDICDRIITLNDVLSRKIDQDRFIYLLCREIMEILNEFPLQIPQLIEKIEANLYQTGKMVNISCENEQISGKCQGLNPDGSLRVLAEAGEKAVVSGVIV